MVRFVLFFFLSTTLFSFTSREKAIDAGSTLEVKLSNIRNSDGHIFVFIYAYENQYPYKPYKHYKVKKDKVKDGNLIVTISNLQIENEFAITIIDDENDNQDLDRWLGIPKEGYGFSNNIRPFLSLPDYSDLVIDLSISKEIKVKLQYKL